MLNDFRIVVLLLVGCFTCNSQNANFVQNGSFEDLINCNNAYLANAKYWDEIDSDQACKINHVCLNSVPYNGAGFQYPKSGNAYISATLRCPHCSILLKRTYSRNRLIGALKQGMTYCVKFFVNINNNSTVGIDGFGAYFGDNSIDTITKAHTILSYLTPQVQNPNNNVIKDTLNWVPITGTFIANGNEIYMILGNFKTEAQTSTLAILPTHTISNGADVSFDDISCIPIDLPAFAGNDTSCIPGTTVYIGRTRDAGIDEACTWYKLHDMGTPIASGVSGLTVSPVQTSTYVVKQQLWCSGIKYDTVVVYKDGVGLEKLKLLNEGLKIYPIPATESCVLSIENENLIMGFNRLIVFNSLGQIVLKKEVVFNQGLAELETGILPGGSYTIELSNGANERIVKKLLIAQH